MNPGSDPEVKCQLGHRLVRLRWSTATAPPGRHTHTHTRSQVTHMHTHSLSYITGHSSAQFTENPSSCVTKFCQPAFPIPHRHFSASSHSTFARTALKTNRAERFSSPSPSFPLSRSTHSLHTDAQESSRLQQETHSNLK